MITYKDPLHIHPDLYTVFYNNEPMYTLNKRLIDQQNAWGNLSKIIELHEFKIAIFYLIHETNDIILMKSLVKDLTEIEFELQALWGFEKNANYHMFWQYPKCHCPKLDNNDNYPHGYYIINKECPLHGVE